MEKKKKKKIQPPPPPQRAREEISADTENTNSVGLKSDGQEAKTSEPKTEGVTTEKKKEAGEEKMSFETIKSDGRNLCSSFIKRQSNGNNISTWRKYTRQNIQNCHLFGEKICFWDIGVVILQ